MKMSLFKDRKADRPRPILEYTRLMAISDAVAMLAFIASVYLVAHAWGELPDRIPVHFNAQGVPDGWGGKGALVFGPVLSLSTGLLLTIVNRYPHTFNFPFPITPANAQRQYTIARELMSMMRTMNVFLGLLIAWMQTSAARDGETASTATALVLVAAIVAPLTLLVIYLARANSANAANR